MARRVNHKEIRKGSILLAEPFMLDPNFKRSVILLTEHSEKEGSLGFVLNKPITLKINELIEDYPNLLLHRLHTDAMTHEEHQLKSFFWRNIKRLQNWDVWKAAFKTQLDEHDKAGVFREPLKRTELPKECWNQIC